MEFCAVGTAFGQGLHLDFQHTAGCFLYGLADLLTGNRTGVLIVVIAPDIDQQVGRRRGLQGDLTVCHGRFQFPEHIVLGLVNADSQGSIVLHLIGQNNLNIALFTLAQIDHNPLTFHVDIQRKLLGSIILVFKGIGFIQGNGKLITEGVADYCRTIQQSSGGQHIISQPVDIPIDLSLVGDVLISGHHSDSKVSQHGQGFHIFVYCGERDLAKAGVTIELCFPMEEFHISHRRIIVIGERYRVEGITWLIKRLGFCDFPNFRICVKQAVSIVCRRDIAGQ